MAIYLQTVVIVVFARSSRSLMVLRKISHGFTAHIGISPAWLQKNSPFCVRAREKGESHMMEDFLPLRIGKVLLPWTGEEMRLPHVGALSRAPRNRGGRKSSHLTKDGPLLRKALENVSNLHIYRVSFCCVSACKTV